MTLWLAALLALPSSAAAPRKAAPAAGVAAAVPALPRALPAVPAAKAGAASVGQAVGVAQRDVAAGIEAASKGGDGAAREAGAAMQAALENARVAPVAKDPDRLASALPAAYKTLLPAAQAAAEKAKLPKPRFTEAAREQSGWTFRFEAGGRLINASFDAQGKPWAYVYHEYTPDAAAALTASAFSQKLVLPPLAARKEGQRRWGAQAPLGLTLTALPKSRDLWFIVDNEDGLRVAVNARSGKTRELPSGPDRERIVAAANSAASYNGRPWSHTEFNMNTAFAEDSLSKDGATEAQFRLFRRLLAEAPIRGGGFNPWSGD
jgi:hypothetical protein